jgi:hypothetical protein
MSGFEKRLFDANNQVLYTQKVAGWTVEVVDVNLVPVVKVAGQGKSSSFPLDKLGMVYSDGDRKFYSEETGDEVAHSELNDRAIEGHLFGLSGGSK